MNASRFCPNCGGALSPQATFCGSCGNQVPAAAPGFVAAPPAYGGPVNLEFRGQWSDLFGEILIIALLSLITLGIYGPWGYVRMRKKVLSLSYYRGRPLAFDGTGGEYFVHVLVISLLSMVTLGFYAILGFASVRILKWDTQHTILPDGRRLEFRGAALDYFGQTLVVGLFTALTFGIYSFWGYVRIRKFELNNTYIQGGTRALDFTGKGDQYLGIALLIYVLTAITFGFYSFLGFAAVRQLKWDEENTILPD